jgi:glutamate racemase
MTSASDAARSSPIGLIDSGIGGLTIWRAIHRLLPNERLVYVADQGFFPYGDRSTDELCDRTEQISRQLLDLGAKLIVLACNTASVQTLAHLRGRFPDTPFVGVVPVIRMLARYSHSGTIALLCTTTTANSPYTAELAERFAPDKKLLVVDCKGLENYVESGELRSNGLDTLLREVLAPLRASGADVVGLSCTHYPLVRHQIKRVLGPGISVYEPSRPVARRVRQVLQEQGLLAEQCPAQPHAFYTTTDADKLRPLLKRILKLDDPQTAVMTLPPT